MKDRELTIAILNKKESSEKYRGEFDANLCSAYIPPPEESDFQSDECQSNDDEVCFVHVLCFHCLGQHVSVRKFHVLPSHFCCCTLTYFCTGE